MVILNGRVTDPETGLDAIRNVGIRNGSISAISEFKLAGTKAIDATGQVVSPGFIDLHAHGQEIGDHRMQAVQGVTSVLELESGVLPIADCYAERAKNRLPLQYGASAAWTFALMATFASSEPEATPECFQDAQKQLAWKNELASPEQMSKVLGMVEEALQQGALGIRISAGYSPGHGQKEYYAFAELAARHGVATFMHVRYASNLEPQDRV